MAKGATTQALRQAQGGGKSYSYTSVFVALLAIGGALMYFDRTSAFNSFGAAFAEKLCDIAQKENKVSDASSEQVPAQVKLTKASSHNPSMSGGKAYNAKEAMQVRWEKLSDVCNKYSDVMRPESLMKDHVPNKDGFVWHKPTSLALCTPYGVGKSAFEALFMRIRNAGDIDDNTALKENYLHTANSYKKAIMVRHPMERLLSIYRKHFAAYTAQDGATVDKDAVSFPDFVHLVVHGPTELAEFIMENQLEGQSLGIDTGMVDAKGESAKWDSYWHQCGLCHKDFKPHFVLQFDHAEEDEKVLIELLENRPGASDWLKVKRTSHVSKEDVLEHFYSQLTKEEIRGIYEKYRVDFELFGYSPDYFLQFGQGN